MNHIERMTEHATFMARVAPNHMTRANLTRLADQRAASARRLRGKASGLHREQRKAALESARAFYALARRVERGANV